MLESNKGNICGAIYEDGIFNNVTIEFNHTSTTLELILTSNLNSLIEDESWGICDLNLWFNECPIGQWYNGSYCFSVCPFNTHEVSESRTCTLCTKDTCLHDTLSFFDCTNINKAETWTYFPEFKI